MSDTALSLVWVDFLSSPFGIPCLLKPRYPHRSHWGCKGFSEQIMCEVMGVSAHFHVYMMHCMAVVSVSVFVAAPLMCTVSALCPQQRHGRCPANPVLRGRIHPAGQSDAHRAAEHVRCPPLGFSSPPAVDELERSSGVVCFVVAEFHVPPATVPCPPQLGASSSSFAGDLRCSMWLYMSDGCEKSNCTMSNKK